MTMMLRQIRLERNMTQNELSVLVGMTRPLISLLERGKTKGSVQVWDRLEAVLGVDQRILRKTAKENSEAKP